MENSNDYTVQQLVNNDSFVQWAKGESEREGAEYWNRWVQEDEGHREKAIRAQKKITGIRFTSPRLPDIKQEWERVRDDIKKKEDDIKENEQKRLHHEYRFGKFRTKNGHWLEHWLKIAAVLLAGAYISFSIFTYEEPKSQEPPVVEHTIETSFGEKKTINLSDGSTIILASGSQITYNSNWLDQPVKRVSLEGEAYFFITPEKTRSQPKFVVETEDGSASVWGTRFTVDTYGEETQVVLEEGEVRLQAAGMENKNNPEVTMQPGQKAIFTHSTSQIIFEEVNPTVYTSWTTRRELFFDNTPFSVLANRIERMYKMNVQVEDPAIMETELSGSIDFRSLDGLIEAVSEVMEVDVRVSEKIISVKLNNNN